MKETIHNLFRRKRDIYRKVFDSPEGKIVLGDLYKFCMIHQPRYVAGDSHQTAFNEGLARVGYRLQSYMKEHDKDIEQYITQSDNYFKN